MDFLNSIEDKEQFAQDIKNAMDETAFEALADLKREMAKDFLTGENDES